MLGNLLQRGEGGPRFSGGRNIHLRLVGHCDYPRRSAGADARKAAKRGHRDEMDTQRKKSKQGEEEGSAQQLKRSQGEGGCQNNCKQLVSPWAYQTVDPTSLYSIISGGSLQPCSSVAL